MTIHKLIAVFALGTTLAFAGGCAAHADASVGPNDPSSVPPPGTSTVTSSPSTTTGSTSSAVTTSPTTTSPATTGAGAGAGAATTPSTTSTTDPAKADKDNPGHPDSGPPGVGNQRKADGTQPGTVGQGPSGTNPATPAKKDTKKDEKKK
jgi:hypothetical protein